MKGDEYLQRMVDTKQRCAVYKPGGTMWGVLIGFNDQEEFWLADGDTEPTRLKRGEYGFRPEKKKQEAQHAPWKTTHN